jgi:hypothetical protein
MTHKKINLQKNFQMDTSEDLFKMYKTNSTQALVFYLLIIFSLALSLVYHDYVSTYKLVVMISIFVPLTLFIVFFIKSYKARYLFYKRINRLERVEYKIPPILYLIIFIPFFFHQKHVMFQEIKVLRQNTKYIA